MHKHLSYLLIVLAALLALAAGIAVQRYWIAAELPDAELPAVELLDLNEHPHRLDDWRGQVVLVNFWASWCEPCREEIPLLNQLQQRYAAQGLQVVGVAVDDEAAVAQFQTEQPLNYPVLLAPEAGFALMDELGDQAGVLPYSALFDRSGRLVRTQAGSLTAEQADALLTPLLAP